MGKSLEQRVAELEKQMKKITREKAIFINKSFSIGDTFELAGLKWKILDITDKGYMCLADKFEESMEFDSDSNDWRKCGLREYLNSDFLEELSEAIGEDNIIPFHRDLFSLDGQTEYGTCEDKVSLLTIDEYRQYRKLIPNTDDFWWWMITPWSTPCNNYKKSVTVVSSSGIINNNNCSNDCGVRPFCILSSTIFESEEK